MNSILSFYLDYVRNYLKNFISVLYKMLIVCLKLTEQDNKNFFYIIETGKIFHFRYTLGEDVNCLFSVSMDNRKN